MKSDSFQSIMLTMAEARSLAPILNRIVEGAAEAFDLTLARLWLLELSSDCPLCSATADNRKSPSAPIALHLRGSAGKSKLSRKRYSSISGSSHQIALGDRKIGKIALSGQPILIPHISGNEPWIADPAWIKNESIQSFAGQPLIFRGETLGVLAVFSRSVLSEEDFNLLRTFANHAAVAIANARAFEELDRLKNQLKAENQYLHEEIREALHFGTIIGESAALKKVLEQVALVADTTATVLIQGESGTGKELIARAIHDRSPRAEKPFIKVNCAAIPENLFESEFFGHAKGAFTGAMSARVGRFELAHTGDIFLDEIGEIPLPLQTKLLRVLQEKQFERVGETRTRTVDVRIICATNRDLKREVEAQRFREDLYYRLTVFPIDLPPLRARKDDIPALASHFIRKSAARIQVEPPRLTRENLRELRDYDWPGNIRELENVVERSMILAKTTGRLHFTLTPTPRPSSPKASVPASEQRPIWNRDQLKQREIQNILAALQQSNGKIFGPGGAAKLLGLRPTTLASRLKALGLRKRYFPPSEG